MIEKINVQGYELQCDFCGHSEEFEEFQDAVNHKKANKWKSLDLEGEWVDKCPPCIEHDNFNKEGR